MTSNWKTPLASLALGAGLIAGAGHAAAAVDPYDGNWHFSLTPYLWFPNINGSADVNVGGLRDPSGAALGGANLSTEIGPNDYLENLQFAIMATGEARKGLWSIFTDIIYIDFGDQETHARSLTGPLGQPLEAIDRDTETGLSSTVWTLAGAYTLARSPTYNFDVLAGFRYLDLNRDLKWSLAGSQDILPASGRVSQDESVWNGIVGFKGQVRLGDGHWFIPYYADIGTGSSNWTWQALVGLGYGFGWGDLSLSIRSLSYDFDKDDADLRMTGPALGVSFRW
jgi:hypothetical protein